MTWIQTLDGKRFDLLEPDYLAIDPHTLSVVLSRMCRFGCHCEPFYSVAQHSLMVSHLVLDDSLRLPALLHDAHEAYWGFGDICRPAKCLNDDVRRFFNAHAKHIDAHVARRFGFGRQMLDHEQIKLADNIALATEARDLMMEPPCPWDALPTPHFDRIEPLSVDDAYRHFSARLYELWEDVG